MRGEEDLTEAPGPEAEPVPEAERPLREPIPGGYRLDPLVSLTRMNWDGRDRLHAWFGAREGSVDLTTGAVTLGPAPESDAYWDPWRTLLSPDPGGFVREVRPGALFEPGDGGGAPPGDTELLC